MTSKERILACCNGCQPDHVPLTTWCFGFKPKKELIWEKSGKRIKHWYSLRMEHIHTLPECWDIQDDFRRVLAWQSLGVDDILDVSVPWSMHPDVTWKDSLIPRDAVYHYPVTVREYTTPAGKLRHAVYKTENDQGEGWVIQPDYPPLFDEYQPRCTMMSTAECLHASSVLPRSVSATASASRQKVFGSSIAIKRAPSIPVSQIIPSMPKAVHA